MRRLVVGNFQGADETALDGNFQGAGKKTCPLAAAREGRLLSDDSRSHMVRKVKDLDRCTAFQRQLLARCRTIELVVYRGKVVSRETGSGCCVVQTEEERSLTNTFGDSSCRDAQP
jgi:hypothetical protein